MTYECEIAIVHAVLANHPERVHHLEVPAYNRTPDELADVAAFHVAHYLDFCEQSHGQPSLGECALYLMVQASGEPRFIETGG